MSKFSTLRILKNNRGVSALEFALCFPLFMLFVTTGFDLVHAYYAKALINTELTRISRLSETGNFTNSELDSEFTQRIQNGIPGATVKIERKFFRNFSSLEGDVITVDANNNGILDENDCFFDKNGNDVFDVDGGIDGSGNAEDSVYYEVTVDLDMLFNEAAGALGIHEIKATSLVRNQPFQSRENPPEPKEVCIS